MPTAYPNEQQILEALHEGPQRLSLLRVRYGQPVQHTISVLRRKLAGRWVIVGAYEQCSSTVGMVRDFVYRLERER